MFVIPSEARNLKTLRSAQYDNNKKPRNLGLFYFKYFLMMASSSFSLSSNCFKSWNWLSER